MKRILTALTLSIVGFAANAQQDPQFSQFMFNKLSVNPAYAGASDAICGTLLYRDQWDKFPGAPKTAVLALDAPVPVLHGGVGLNLMNDIIGNEKTVVADVSYAYRMYLGTGNLAFGIKAGMLQKSFIESFHPSQDNDPAIPKPGTSALVPDFSGGAYYNTKSLYFGVSMTHMAAPTLKYDAGSLSQIRLALARHYYIMAGYNYEIDPKLTLKPSILIKSDPTTPQFDLNLNLLYNNFVWGGVSYRYKDAIVAMVGFEYNNLKFGYAFDVTTSNIRSYNKGTHEIMVGYCYKKPKITNFKMHKNVRFL
jgi:type IX secretion system PorP/SprF family membrane protein